MSLGPYGYQQAYQQEMMRREMQEMRYEMEQQMRYQRLTDQYIQPQSIDKPAQQTPDKRLLLLEV